LFGTLVRS